MPARLIGLIISFGMTGVYVWAVLKWVHAREYPTELTTFRSWKVNFIAFWVYIGASFLNIICALNWMGFGNNGGFLTANGPYFGVGLGSILVAGGVFLGWRIKQLWLEFDEDRSLALAPFDYFVWEDEEPEEEPKEETETAIDEDGVDEEETKEEGGEDTTTTETANTNSTTDNTKTDNSNTNGGNNSSTTTTTGGDTKTDGNTTGGTTTGGDS